MSLEEHPYLETSLWNIRSKQYEHFKYLSFLLFSFPFYLLPFSHDKYHREKWKVPIPNARYFVAIPDYFNVLHYGEVFIR